jgi:hypothetical protein
MIDCISKIIVSKEFENISIFLSSIGSLGAILVALHLANKNIKPIVDVYGYIGAITSMPDRTAYIITIVNKSPYLNLVLSVPLYALTKRKFLNTKQDGLIFSNNQQLDNVLNMPKTLKYGESHIFYILPAQVESTLKACKYSKIKFIISDSIGNKFEHIVERKILKKVIENKQSTNN